MLRFYTELDRIMCVEQVALEVPLVLEYYWNCCALCLGVVDWHNCGTVLGALECGVGFV